MNDNDGPAILVGCIVAALVFPIVFVLFAYIYKWGWNEFMTGHGLPDITFWQAVCIQIFGFLIFLPIRIPLWIIQFVVSANK